MVEEAGTWGKRGDVVVHERDPFNAESPLLALTHAPLTSAEAFYVRNHGPVPELDPQEWRLAVDGLVRRSLELSLEDLRDRFEHHRLTATMQCAGNRRSGPMQVRDIPGHP